MSAIGAVPSGAKKAEFTALGQIKESARALLEQGKGEEAWELFLSALEAVLVKNRELELLVAKLRRVGTTSERIDPAQLSLMFQELFGQGNPQVQGDPEAEAKEDAQLDREIKRAQESRPDDSRKKRKSDPGWRTHGVERRVHQVEVPEAQRICACGRQKKKIGEDVTRKLEYVPAHFVEEEYHRDKYACGFCKDGVTTAPGPEKVLERSAAGASLLAQVAVSKYADHTPLHRQNRIYARSGAQIPVSTLSDWMAGVGDLIDPLVQKLAEKVLASYIVRTDATGLKVLDPQSPGNIQRGSMWAYIGDDRDVLFRYTPTGAGESGPWEFLAGREGMIQADASNVFDRLFNGQVAKAVEIGCWAHGRRRLVALQDMDFRVAYPLKLIARLYRIEHLADARGLSSEERAALRRERSTPVLEKLRRWFVSTRANEPPSTDLGRAAGYFLNHWVALTRFVDDGRIALDNNLCESQMRDIALGRKNYLFAGSHDAARRAAGIYSLLRTCAQYGVPPLPYFTDILGKLGNGWAADRLDDLLPHRWQPSAAGSENQQAA